jgi:hypothetical protein
MRSNKPFVFTPARTMMIDASEFDALQTFTEPGQVRMAIYSFLKNIENE